MSKERFGITDAHYLCDSAIFNTETNEILRLYQLCDLLNQQDAKIEELEKEINKLRTLKAYRDDAKMVEVVNGVEFTQEQCSIIEVLKYNYEFQIKDLKQQLAEQPKKIIEDVNLALSNHIEMINTGVEIVGMVDVYDISMSLKEVLKEYSNE